MTLINPAYTSLAAMQRRFSAAGVTDFADHDDDGTADTGVVDDAINQATEEITLFCDDWYTPAALATSKLVERWATLYACVFLCQNRGNPVPETFQVEMERISKLLESIHNGTQRIPGLSLKADLRPSFSNLGTDRRYLHRKIRVKPNSTSAPSVLGQDKVPYPPYPPIAE